MHSLFATIAAALLLFALAALGAPTRQHPEGDACLHVKRSSLELNKIARLVSLEIPQAYGEADISTSLLTIEAKDKCDPGSLRNDSVPCILKIFSVLKKYNSAMERVGQIQTCSEFANQVRPAVEKLHMDMEKCVSWKTEMRHQEETDTSAQPKPSQEMEPWEEDFACHFTMDRLFSFSVVTARVFALGDPANHKLGAAATCV